MRKARIAIVGAGLSGLHAARLLERAGVRDYVLLEARPRLGGRIQSLEGFDLGATWFWPGFQGELDQLIGDLKLPRFAQPETGETVFEGAGAQAPLRVPGFPSSPVSMRLAGGMQSLVDAVRKQVDPERIVTGHVVRRLRCMGEGVELEAEDSEGRLVACRVECVLLAVPPRLAVSTLDFAPALPDALLRSWRHTATWMAPHAKYLAVYEKPFWREQGLSGAARSARGPLAEIHDASDASGRGALFGFFGIPAAVRRNWPEAVLMQHCRAQLARLFGPAAAEPLREIVMDWAADPFTATPADQDGRAQHEPAPAAMAEAGAWRGRLVGIASEWSPQFPGYVAGAIEAARRGVHAWMDSKEMRK